uniref:Uncharacterized protein n=1 Tax=Romanomermis culicivorax TaxID=13658 RepID=A0A915KGF5_ROMCU
MPEIMKNPKVLALTILALEVGVKFEGQVDAIVPPMMPAVLPNCTGCLDKRMTTTSPLNLIIVQK